WLARASLYELLLDLRGRDGEAQGVDILARAAETNPYLDDYPWRLAYPEAHPEAPARALGLDLWFVALRDRPPFVTYWSGLAAAWLALTLVALAVRLRAAARSTAAGGLEADVATTTRAAEVAAI
ncbi:MAG TPA: hypothetical protein VHN78_07940, partial [Chloroflexota bacterium]|nr:hypothetical protein [Chloroflexota bacterium]